jgi:hypothetical protein
MNTRQRKTLRIGVLSALVAATGMTLGACAPYYSDAEVLIYERATRSDRQPPKAPAQPLTMDPQDRSGGGAGGGGGGGGGH